MTTSFFQIILYMVVALLPAEILAAEDPITGRNVVAVPAENGLAMSRRTNDSRRRINELIQQQAGLINNASNQRGQYEYQSTHLPMLPQAQAQTQEEAEAQRPVISLPLTPTLPTPPPPPPLFSAFQTSFGISAFGQAAAETPKNNYKSGGGAQVCGGILKASHGSIQTPHFPKQFPVPIECIWVIDASEIVPTSANVTIVVYLTQLYVLGGLKFTEYMYYSDDYKVPSHRVFQLTEDDVTQVAWIQFNSQYLEIKFQMNSLDGTQLRALDRLLDVYGFNITYEVDTVKPYQCNALQCRFLGHCFAKQDYTGYYCSCFPGFSGTDCGRGPLCEDPHTNFCQNGGTCKHIGDAAVTCHCPAGFKGNKCEIPEISEITRGCTENSSSIDCQKECNFDNSYAGQSYGKSFARTSARTGKTRYEVTIRLGANLTALHRSAESERKASEHLPTLLERHMSRVLRNFNITRINDLELISNSSDRLDITFHFFGVKSDSFRIREAITRMVERGRIGNITLVSNFHLFDENPPLKLMDITVNQKSAIREDNEFIISCIAQGSAKIQFQWYKDGAIVNATKATREIWTTVLPPESKDVYTAILGVTQANRMDEGIYTCKVVDWGVEQCRSLHVHIKSPPRLRVDPASVTLHRGDSLRVRCLSPGNDIKRYGQLGYSWTRNGVLFQSDPLTVMWEDLYPDGSILKINNIQKSAEYSCVVSNSVKPVSKRVYVTVIDRNAVQLCHAEKSYGVRWPTSAPGAAIISDCPKLYEGFSRRICEKRDVGNSSWLQPDFSHCIADQMLEIYNKFRALTSGYQKTNCSAILKSCLLYTVRRHTKFLPGEAGFLMDLLQEVESYLEVKGTQLEREMAAEIVLHVLDKVMQNVESLNSQQQIKKLQLLTQSAALNRETIAASQLATSTSSSSASPSSSAAAGSRTSSGGVLITSASSSSSSSSSASASSSLSTGRKQLSATSLLKTETSAAAGGGVGNVESIGTATLTVDEDSLSLDRLNSLRIYMTSVKTLPFNLRIYGDDLFSDQLYMDIGLSKRLHNIMANSTIFASVISYKNLKSFLPKTYYSRGSDTTDTDYVLASRIIQTWLFQSNRSNDNLREPLDLPFDAGHVEIIFQHESAPKNTDWTPVCGHDYKATFESTWRTDLCITKNLMENITRCICPLSGTFVVMLTKRNANSTMQRPSVRPIFVIISCSCCLLQSCTAFAILLPIWYNRKCAITFLKMQFCISTSSVMVIFLLGFLKMLPQNWQAIISSTLASLMLLGLSTLIAICLVVHSELVPKKLLLVAAAKAVGSATSTKTLTPTTTIVTNKKQEEQQQQHKQQNLGEDQLRRRRSSSNLVSPGIRSAIGISWLLPLLFGICTPLICSIIGKWPQNWWIEVSGGDSAGVGAGAGHGTSDGTISSAGYADSSSVASTFIIFIVVEILFIVLFILLLITSIRKLLWLLRKHHHYRNQQHHQHHPHQHQHHQNGHDKYISPIWRRIGQLYRTGIILLLKLATDGLFIAYVNTTADAIWSHLFGISCILLGFSMLLCFVIKAENKQRSYAERGSLKKISTKSSLDDTYCSSSINSPLNFYANHEKERDNESGAAHTTLVSSTPSSLIVSGSSTQHMPLTFISTAPRCQMIAGIQTTDSVETFLGGIVGGQTTAGSTTTFAGKCPGLAGGSLDRKMSEGVGGKSGSVVKTCLHEMEQYQLKTSFAEEQSTATTIDGRGLSSLSSRCCGISILGAADITSPSSKLVVVDDSTSWQPSQQHEILSDTQSFYDAFSNSSLNNRHHHPHHHYHHLHLQQQQHQQKPQQMLMPTSQVTKCPLPPEDSHEFVGVETLDILKGVSPDSIIGIRASTILPTKTSINSSSSGFNANLNLHHHKPFVELTDQTPKIGKSNIINNSSTNSNSCSSSNNNNNNNNNNNTTITTSSVTTQTPKSQKRVTIVETPKIAHTFDPLIPLISAAQNSKSLPQGRHSSTVQQTSPTPIITITCSSIDDATISAEEQGESEATSMDCATFGPNKNTITSTTGCAGSGVLSQVPLIGVSQGKAASVAVASKTTEKPPQNNNDENISPDTEEENSINGMFDRITHDLDYLLNRTNEVPQRLSSSSSNDAASSGGQSHIADVAQKAISTVVGTLSSGVHPNQKKNLQEMLDIDKVNVDILQPPLPPTGSIPASVPMSSTSLNSISSINCHRSAVHHDTIIEESEQE